jgi:hypothetical protein
MVSMGTEMHFYLSIMIENWTEREKKERERGRYFQHESGEKMADWFINTPEPV